MRIAFFFWSLQLGGVEHMMVNLSRELVEKGHDVDLVLARSPAVGDYKVDSRVKVRWLNSFGLPSTIVRLSFALSRGKYDVIYTAMPTSNIAAIIANFLSLSRSKVVISERSNPQLEASHSPSWRYRAAFTLQPYLYPRASAIVAVCSDLADSLSIFSRIDRDTIKVIYNPAYDDRIIRNKPEVPHPWLQDKKVPVIVTAGRLMPQKDHATLLKAFAMLRMTRSARLIILGDGPLRNALEAQISDFELNDSVLLPGFVPDIYPWLVNSEIFALTSIWEGFGNVLVQALAAGCSIVSTDCPNGPREILADGRYGKLTKVGDVEALALAFDEVLESKPFDSFAQRKRAEFFSASRSAHEYESLFLSLTGSAT